MPSESHASKPRNTLQQAFMRLSPVQQNHVIREESERLEEHFVANPEEILPDIADVDEQ